MDPLTSTNSDGKVFELRPIACPTCETRDFDVIGFRGGAYHRYGLGVTTQIVRCKGCELYFPEPFPFPRDPDGLYGDPSKYFFYDDEENVQAYRPFIHELIAASGKAKPSMIDVGCGRAEVLRAARLEGLDDLVGLDFAKAMQELAATRGVKIELCSVEDYQQRCGRTFDVVLLNAVLEHVYDPSSMVAAVSRLLAPGGVVYLDLPREPHLLATVGNLVNRMRGNHTVLNLAPTWPPYHVFGFNERAITKLLEKHGFDVEKIVVQAGTRVPHKDDLKDRARALVATQVLRVANLTGTAPNMFVWGRRRA